MRRLRTTTPTIMSGNFADYLAIKNVLALYCVALDTKDFSILEEVFVQDAVTIYPFDGGNMQGVDQIAAVISKRCVRFLFPFHAVSFHRLISVHSLLLLFIRYKSPRLMSMTPD